MSDFPRASPSKWWKTKSIGRIHRSPHAMFVSRMRWYISTLTMLGLLLLIGGVWYLTNPKRLSAMSGLLLSHVLGARVTVDNAKLSWTGTLRLTGVKLRTNPGVMPSTTLFSADQLEVHFNWLGLFSGRLHASQISAVHPMLNLVDDLDTGQWNYEQFVQSAGVVSATTEGQHATPPHRLNRPVRLPIIVLSDAIVRWGEIRRKVYHLVGQSLVNAKLGPKPQSHSTYQLDMRQQTLNGQPGIILTGLYNISTREFTAHVGHLAFTPGFRRTLPAPVQHLWQKLHLRGGVRNIVFRVSPASGLHIRAVLDDVSVQTVAPSRRLGPQVIPLNHLNGSVAISNRGFAITQLRGTVLGWKFEVPSAHFDGYEAGAPFDLTVMLPNMNLPMPYPKLFSTRTLSLAAAIFHRLRPSGLLSLTVHIVRPQLNAAPAVHGEIQCENMQARYVNFPYPMRHVHGLIRFSAHHIEFVNVQAIAETFPVSLQGRVAINENDGPINLTVSSPHAYFDRRLAACLPVDIRPIWNRFNPVGIGGFICHVTHAAGTHGDPTIVLHIFPKDVSGAYRDLPFPLQHVHGSLIFTDHETRIIKLQAPVGANGNIIFTGKVTYSPDNLAKLKPMVHLRATDIPINQTLLGSLPGSWARWIKALHVQAGSADLDAMITRGSAGNPAVRGKLNIHHAGMAPPQLPWPLKDVDASAHISPNGLTLNTLTGHSGADGKGTFVASGAVMEPDTGPVSVNAQGSWKGIQIAGAAPAHVPPMLAEFLNKWNVRGRSNGEFTYSVQAHQVPLSGATVLRHQLYKVRVSPLAMSVAPTFLPAPLAGLTGEVDLSNGLVQLKKLHAISGSTQLTVSGAYKTGTDALQLSLDAQGPHLPAKWMSLIPVSTLHFIQQIKPNASWFLELPTVQRTKVGKAYRWRFTGSLVLNDLATLGVIKLSASRATITIAGDLAPGSSFPMLAGQFGVTKLNWAGRIADPLAGNITADSATHIISIDKINGKVGGGALTGHIRIHTGKNAGYAVACQLHGTELSSLLSSPATTQSAKGIQASTGIVDASLTMNATLGSTPTRRGSGQLVIHKASIYDVPMAMGLMQIATLRLPISSNFKHAEVRYTIHNNVVRFKPIFLTSPGVNLVGEGTLNLKTTNLNLSLLTQSPHGSRIPILGFLFGLARSQLLELRVSGPVAHPVIVPVPLRFLAWPFIGFGQ